MWGMARNLRFCGQMRSCSLSRQFTIPKMTGFVQRIRVTSPWMTGWCFGDINLLLLWSGPLLLPPERRLPSSSLKRGLRWISMCIWPWWTSWFPGLMQHSEKVELFSSRMEPRPTQLIASRSGLRGTWMGSGQRNYNLPYLQIWSPWILKSGAFWRVNPAFQIAQILGLQKHIEGLLGQNFRRNRAYFMQSSSWQIKTCSESKTRIYWKLNIYSIP